MSNLSNTTNISLPLAVFLATDHYDHDDTTISATSLIKPVRQLILADRVPKEAVVIDISSRIASAFGTALHDGIENAWLSNHRTALFDLGYPSKVTSNIRLNPTDEYLDKNPDCIPIYTEQRMYREIDGFKISGKADFITDGINNDYKSTKVYAYMKGTKTEINKLQGSIYRWLNPKRITAEYMLVHYLLLNWEAHETYKEGYPPSQITTVKQPIYSLQETETYIRNKLSDYVKYKDADEADIPLCTPDELWMDPPTFKYYKNPSKANEARARSTKNFTNKQEAYTRLATDNNVGIVKEVPGQARACKYCPAFMACKQKDYLIAEGALVL